MGRHLLGRGRWKPEELAKAIDYFQQAIAADPEYGPAHAGLSDAWRLHTVRGIRQGNLQKAEAAARRALQLDPGLAEAHTSLGGVLWRHWKWDEAEAELRLAIELEPEYAESRRVYGIFLMTLRRFEESVAVLKRARELDPLSPTISVEYALGLTKTGRLDEALLELERARQLDPTFSRVYQGIAFVHAARRDWEGAIAALELPPAQPRGETRNPWLGYYYSLAGRETEARAVLNSIESYTADDVSTSLYRGIVHLGLGNREQAFALLEEGIRDRPAEPSFTVILFDYLSDDPSYRAILDEMDLHFTS
jgi:serine/threonine-protein kinase